MRESTMCSVRVCKTELQQVFTVIVSGVLSKDVFVIVLSVGHFKLKQKNTLFLVSGFTFTTALL